MWFVFTKSSAEKITPNEVVTMLNRVYSTVASISKGELGLRAEGIVPYNRIYNVFSKEDFSLAEILMHSLVVGQDFSIIAVIAST